MNVLEAVQNVTRAWLQARGVRSRTERMADHEVHHYVLEGTGGGPPVFLVHGLGGSANGYAAILFGLARRFRRIHALDMPGHGLSPEPAVPLTLRAQMDLLHAYARRELPQPALVVGNSLGGALSIQLAAEAPEHVRALALLAPGGARVEEARMEELWNHLDVRTPEQAREMSARLFHRLPLSLRLFGSHMQSFYGTPTVRALIEEARREQALAPEMLASLRPPVLLWWGEGERLLPYEGVEYFRAHLPPGSKVEVVPGSGHVPQIEVPDLVVQRLVRFADDLGL
ncbi:MAG TPA: alpha/beta fold hydrolase [Myxococcaceae bacterium]|nr:alpha/beta fold hydrolase [Myxococcaceae bacterium]